MRRISGFIQGDAQTYAFRDAVFDVIISRFGVMFFQDAARAFANLLQATSKAGALRVIAWRSVAENPFMTAAACGGAVAAPAC
jgi:ubiquinone/menaquinone biosynthesis C-methylase UbiE